MSDLAGNAGMFRPPPPKVRKQSVVPISDEKAHIRTASAPASPGQSAHGESVIGQDATRDIPTIPLYGDLTQAGMGNSRTGPQQSVLSAESVAERLQHLAADSLWPVTPERAEDAKTTEVGRVDPPNYRLYIRIAVLIAIGLTALLFVVGNSEQVQVRIIFSNYWVPMYVVIVMSIVLGLLIGALATAILLHRREKRKAGKRQGV